MSFKRGSKPPARPPPPRGSLSLAGMSFKKLEQEEEEEEEDLTISDKYASLLNQTRSYSASSVISSSDLASTTPASVKTDIVPSEADNVDKSSPQKKGGKSVFEYKEILSGLKGRIQEKISKTIEDISGDSSASASPDKEHPLAGSLNPGLEATSNTNNKDEPIAKTNTVKFRTPSPAISVRSQSVPQSAVAAHEESQLPRRSLEKRSSSQPAQLSALITEDDSGEENILVFEEHFKEEPFEDFSGGLTTSTVVRSRSKLKPLKKNSAKTVVTASLSGLLRTPSVEENSKELSSENKKQESSVKDDSTFSPNLLNSVPFVRLISQDKQSVQWTKSVALISSLFVYFIFPMPSFLSGFIAGCIITTLGWIVYNWILQPPMVKEPPVLTPIDELPPMEIPEMKDPTLEDGIYKGWMNEISNYNPDDYHINHTYSVFVTLDGTALRLQRPKNPVPKRAMHDENIATANFIHQRHFELKGSRVYLQPDRLVKKRLWSKKYPICLELAKTGVKLSSLTDSSVDSGRNNKTVMGFEMVSEEKCDSRVLFLFARTGKEKEEWFHRFFGATQGKPIKNPVLEMRRAIERQRQKHHRRVNSDGSVHQRHHSTDSQSSASDSAESTVAEADPADPVLDFTVYMGHLMPAGAFTRLLSPSKTDKESGPGSGPRLPFTGSIICDSQLYWLNALIGRCFYDFLRDTWWTEKVKDKLQRKLSKIHVPYFIEELQVTAIDMGKEMPVIRRAANPYLDERGFWVELDISYGGGFQMTIETKMNLMKLKTSNPKQTSFGSGAATERSPVTDSDEEDSAESSTDDEEEVSASPEEKESSGGSRKLMKYLNKLTSSKYFQQATEYKYIKRAMENVSNTPLQLQVIVKHLVGKLAVNVPPPPSDRLWYGFRGVPRLWLVAKPQVGERAVTITHITDWIERKLELEFQRVFVMPNMDDLIIPILRPTQSECQANELGNMASFSTCV